MHQDEMTEDSVVAIWIGDHTDELDLDSYINERFEGDFGFRFNERRMPEIDVREEPVPIEELLEGFSMWKDWHSQAVGRCRELGIQKASSAVVFHFLRFDLNRCVVSQDTEVRFIGNFDWQEKSD